MLLLLLWAPYLTPLAGEVPTVALMRTPDDGIQPQAVVGADGVLHLIYFKGKPLGGDIFYVRKVRERDDFSSPIRVNSQPGSAIAVGTIRGAHLAVGKNGRVHAAWMGGEGAARPGIGGGKEVVPMLYARLNDAGGAFEPERNLITWATGLDGGGSLAADPDGNVYVAWHANPGVENRGESVRAVFIARSADEGKTFKREQQANPRPTGACGCCGMRAFAGSDGALCIAYRSANDVSRDMTLLVSRDRGASFDMTTLNKWMTRMCPMSSASFAQAGAAVVVATESEDRVVYDRIDPRTLKLSTPVSGSGGEKRKHPAVAANARGEVLLAGTEGAAWGERERLAWQLFGQNGEPLSEIRRVEGVPPWSSSAAFVMPDDSFVILY